MARLIAALIRHGDYHQPDNVPSAHLLQPLTAIGEKQARAVAREICLFASAQGCVIAPTIDCSVLLRGWQTANIMAEALNEDKAGASFHTEQFDNLTERCLGGAANLRIDEIEAALAKDPRIPPLPAGWKSKSEYRLPVTGAESMMQAGQRVARHIVACLQRLRDAIDQDTIKLFVGHGASFRHAALDLGVLTAADIPLLSMHHAKPVYLEWLENGDWAHIGGDWKRRKIIPQRGQDMD